MLWRKASDRTKVIHNFEVYEEIAEVFSNVRTKPWSIARFSKGGIILDLGSGPCINGIYAAKSRGRYLICLDASFSMALISRKNIARENLLGDAIAADMLFLPFRNSAVDSILSIASLHHIPKGYGLRILREIGRVAKPRSIVIITVWSWRQLRFAMCILRNALLYIFRIVDKLRECYVPWRKKGRVYQRYYYLYSLDELIDICIRAGLKILSSGYIGYLRDRSDNIYIFGTAVS
ncbi:MAG: class I SAM-dependent methyltransferase [Ignisphaera sp.]